MRRSDFSFDLPAELIAQAPAEHRRDSRLLVLCTGSEPEDRQFTDLPGLLRAGDLVVFNDTRVIPARLTGRKASGGRVEVLIERITGARTALAQVRASKSPKASGTLEFDDGVTATVTGREGDMFLLEFDRPVEAVLAAIGHIPLPPYIERPDTTEDSERYQTIYARAPGAVAAPTAGLHFDQAMLDELTGQGVALGWLTLHVGAGTFQPVRTEEITEHTMHHERYEISDELARAITATRARGGRIVAVGTTVVRALESAADDEGKVSATQGETAIFITPGYRFRVVDALVTNFHLPESTLLMLVCAFAGYERVLAAYRHAVAQRYRFFSYGDAMFVERNETGA